MPYIKPEYRPFYNAMINTILSKIFIGDTNNFIVERRTFANHILQKDIKGQDGDFNYFIFKWMKTLNFITHDEMFSEMQLLSFAENAPIIMNTIFDFIIAVYVEPSENYYNYNRALGMLSACRSEIERRYGIKNAIPALEILRKLYQRLYYEKVSEYEDTKICENGDVEGVNVIV